jgi:outer membrane receptor protein involved in Fe transport
VSRLQQWFALALLCIGSFSLWGQQTAVTGVVVEGYTKEPMPFVNVAIFQSTDSLLIAENLTDTAGMFHISAIGTGPYFIRTQIIGFHDHRTEPFQLSPGTELNLGSLEIMPLKELLGEVTITEDKPLLTLTIDRKIYNVGQDISSTSGSASDVMANVPSVTVDIDGNVSLRGSSNVTILVDGRPSALLRRNPGTALQQIPASAIDRIEVITNPSAEFKPDGTSGIINIVMKKGGDQGFNATVRANIGNELRHNGTLSLNHRTAKLNAFGSYGYRQDDRQSTFTEERSSLGSDSNPLNHYTSEAESASRPFSHRGLLGFDVYPSQKTELGLAASFFQMKLDRERNAHIVFQEPVGTITSELEQSTTITESEKELELSGHFEHRFDEDHTVAIDGAFTRLLETEVLSTLEAYSLPSSGHALYDTRITLHELPWDVSIEYVRPLGEEGELETGYAGEFIRQQFDFESWVFDYDWQEWFLDDNKSHKFNWSQDIHALYATYGNSLESLGFLVGLRAEQSLISSHLVELDSLIPNNYFKVYPTLHLSYELTKGSELGLSYSKRVHRLEGDEMNPFPVYTDARNAEAGNPYIKPEQVHAFELSYRYQNNQLTLMPTLYYRYLFDGFEEVNSIINDSVVLTTYDNIDSKQSAGLELILSTRLAKLVSLNFSADAFYEQIDAGNLGLSPRRSAFSWSARLNANLDVTTTTMLQLNTHYRSATISAQGTYADVFVLNTGARQQLFRKRADLTLTVSDVFNTMRWENTLSVPGELYQHVHRKRKSQVVYVGFTWRFGKAALKKVEELKFDEGS